LILVLPSFPEKLRIVAKIEELFSHLDAGVEDLHRSKAKLKRYRQAVLKAAVEGKLTEGVAQGAPGCRAWRGIGRKDATRT